MDVFQILFLSVFGKWGGIIAELIFVFFLYAWMVRDPCLGTSKRFATEEDDSRVENKESD